MTKKDSLIHLFCACLAIAGIWFFLVLDKTAGSALSKRQSELEQAAPEILFIGNSILRAGIDTEALTEQMGMRTFKAFSNGASSAWWYLYIKNVLCVSQHSPKYAVVVFRDHFLTDPAFRTEGEYELPLRTLSKQEEPLLARLLPHLSGGRAGWGWMAAEAKSRWDTRIWKLTADLMGVNKHRMEEALQKNFAEQQMNLTLLTQAQLISEKNAGEDVYDFHKCCKSSFLPEMISLLQQKGITPIFVRVKRRQQLYQHPSNELSNYMVSLESYLNSRQALFFDFYDDSRIQIQHFGPGDHLNSEGKKIFTQIVQERLLSVI